MCQDPNVQAADQWDADQIANEHFDAIRDEAIDDMMTYIYSGEGDELENCIVLATEENHRNWVGEYGKLLAKKEYRDASIIVTAAVMAEVKEMATYMVDDLA